MPVTLRELKDVQSPAMWTACLEHTALSQWHHVYLINTLICSCQFDICLFSLSFPTSHHSWALQMCEISPRLI